MDTGLDRLNKYFKYLNSTHICNVHMNWSLVIYVKSSVDFPHKQNFPRNMMKQCDFMRWSNWCSISDTWYNFTWNRITNRTENTANIVFFCGKIAMHCVHCVHTNAPCIFFVLNTIGRLSFAKLMMNFAFASAHSRFAERSIALKLDNQLQLKPNWL